MADIIVTCVQCGNNITISEFVTSETITCMKCKGQVPVPSHQGDPTVPVTRLKLALAKVPEPPPAPVPPPGKYDKRKAKAVDKKNVQQYMPRGGKQRVRSRKASTFEVKVLPWLLFVVLLLVFGWLRYASVLPPDVHQMFIRGGVWSLLLLHISVICLAFGDDVFSGILCFIIPGYSIYYLFNQADQILLRGLVAALLIVFGWDFMLAAGALWNEVYANISYWIATTDTMKKR